MDSANDTILLNVLAFDDDVEVGPVQSDTITGDWGTLSVKKWDYDADGTCPAAVAENFTKTDADSMNQTDETNNTKYICLFVSDGEGYATTVVSANPINIDATGPVLSFDDDVAVGPTQSDTVVPVWEDAEEEGDAVVKLWKYDADGTCPTTAAAYATVAEPEDRTFGSLFERTCAQLLRVLNVAFFISPSIKRSSSRDIYLSTQSETLIPASLFVVLFTVISTRKFICFDCCSVIMVLAAIAASRAVSPSVPNPINLPVMG